MGDEYQQNVHWFGFQPGTGLKECYQSMVENPRLRHQCRSPVVIVEDSQPSLVREYALE